MAKAPVKKQAKPSLVDAAARLKTPAKIAVFAVAALVLGGAFYALFYMPYSEERDKLEAGISGLRNDTSQQEATLKKHQAVAAYSEAIAVAYNYMKKYLPQENEMSQLVQMVSEIAARAGLTDGVTQFAPKLPAELRQNYAEIPFTMTLEGEFLTVLNFMYDFSRMNRIVNITQVDIGSPKMVDERREMFYVTVKCAGSTYRALTEAEVKAQSEPQKKKK